MIVHNDTIDMEKNLQQRIKQAKSFFKFYVKTKNYTQRSNDRTINSNSSLLKGQNIKVANTKGIFSLIK